MSHIPDSKTIYKIFAVCAPGIENILHSELIDLGINGKVLKGGVEFKGDLLSLYSVNLWLRSASRILVRIGKFKLTSLKDASKKFSKYPWEIYIGNTKKIRIRASCHKSKIYHSGALAERLSKGIAKRLKREIVIEKESRGENAPLIFVRLFKDTCTLSIDSSGKHLHKRGYKKSIVSAPVRENLAASMLLAAKFNGEVPLFDPFCGSGTILIEGAMIASKMPPGRHRTFAFMKWKNFHRELWQKILQHSEMLIKKPHKPIIGIDKDENAIMAANANIQEASFQSIITVKKADILHYHPQIKEPGIIVTNPPYGKRTKENDSLLEFYSNLGKALKSRFINWSLYLILPKDYPNLKRSLAIPLKKITSFSNGGIKVELLKGTL